MGNRTEDASWSENVKNVEMTFPPAGFGFSFVLFGCLFYVVVLVCVWFVCLFLSIFIIQKQEGLSISISTVDWASEEAGGIRRRNLTYNRSCDAAGTISIRKE